MTSKNGLGLSRDGAEAQEVCVLAGELDSFLNTPPHHQIQVDRLRRLVPVSLDQAKTLAELHFGRRR